MTVRFRGKVIFSVGTTQTTEFSITPDILEPFSGEEALADYLDQVQRQPMPNDVHYIRIRSGKRGIHYIAVDHEKSVALNAITDWLKEIEVL